MTDNKEGQPANLPSRDEDTEKLFHWGEILYQQAHTLLGKYLPEAQPQEPTELLVTAFPGYRAKYKGRHHVAVIENLKAVRGMERTIERIKHIGDKSWVEPPEEPQDWDEPDRLLKGVNQFSSYSWTVVRKMVHELIHQRQAELNPSTMPILPDSEEISEENLGARLMEANKAHYRSFGRESLFFPVIEGMAVLGTYYVMTRFADDLRKAGDTATADKVRKDRNDAIRLEISDPKRVKTDVRDDYVSHYREGLAMMRKLYKHFGIQDTPRILTLVDLKACQSINKDSPQYQQMTENPALLPGLEKAA